MISFHPPDIQNCSFVLVFSALDVFPALCLYSVHKDMLEHCDVDLDIQMFNWSAESKL